MLSLLRRRHRLSPQADSLLSLLPLPCSLPTAARISILNVSMKMSLSEHTNEALLQFQLQSRLILDDFHALIQTSPHRISGFSSHLSKAGLLLPRTMTEQCSITDMSTAHPSAFITRQRRLPHPVSKYISLSLSIQSHCFICNYDTYYYLTYFILLSHLYIVSHHIKKMKYLCMSSLSSVSLQSKHPGYLWRILYLQLIYLELMNIFKYLETSICPFQFANLVFNRIF